MKSLTLITFTTFFILLVITSSIASSDKDDGLLDKAKNLGGDVKDQLEEVPKTHMAVIGGVVGGLFVVLYVLITCFHES